jgi:hypothetical protein
VRGLSTHTHTRHAAHARRRWEGTPRWRCC